MPDAQLPGLYAGAEAFVLPSVYEGFGLPVLEAMAAGTPVVAANGPRCPDTCGGAARLAEPDEVGEALLALLGDRAERERLWRSAARGPPSSAGTGPRARSTRSVARWRASEQLCGLSRDNSTLARGRATCRAAAGQAVATSRRS